MGYDCCYSDFILYNNTLEYVPESMPGVADTRFVEREPAEKRSLLSWEQVTNKYIHIKNRVISNLNVGWY